MHVPVPSIAIPRRARSRSPSRLSRLPLAYAAALFARFLADLRRDVCPSDCGLIAVGHAAGIALLASQCHGLAFPVLRGLVEAPVPGPLLYRINTTQSCSPG